MTLLASELLMQQQGLCIDTAASGEEAMRMLDKRDYDLLLVDIELPGMSGYALCSWYRDMCREEERASGYVVAITADPDIEACREFGIDQCLPKPLSNTCIVELLHRLWAVRGSPTRSTSVTYTSPDVPEKAPTVPKAWQTSPWRTA